ncbi:MAG: serine/threonine protein kinase [Myxococcales bacterium]|nr:serine/threonine protein kinase [Myxococcales bacterium]
MGEDEVYPRQLGDRYRLDRRIGSGGMGVVYGGMDLTMRRPVAVKLIRSADGVSLDEEVVGRFLREAKNTARMQHENIVEVFDLGRSGGDLFFVMELLDGESLSTRLRREGPMTPHEAVHVARQMCAALGVAHAAGVIHRDLKPANIMLIRRAGDPLFVKVLDFGVAKSYAPDQETQLTHTGMLVGTIEYMSPEQIMAKPVDGRADVYALGVVMYRMLTGAPPFRDPGVPALIHAHLNRTPRPVSEIEPGVPKALERVIARCLAKDPADRYETMADVSRALAASLVPEELDLPDLEYKGADGADPYATSDKTEVAAPVFDDATVRLERPPSMELPAEIGDAEPNPFEEDTTTAPRKFLDDITQVDRPEPRQCAMCHTVNPPFQRACSACGVSLAPDEQEAVRARVGSYPARTATSQAPAPPPRSGGYPVGAPMPTPYSGTAHASGRVAASSPSLWTRLLRWAGLR